MNYRVLISRLTRVPEKKEPDVRTPTGPSAGQNWHGLSIRQRERLWQQDDAARPAWGQQATSWSQCADAQYRACTELRPVTPGTGAIRVGVKDVADVAGFPTRLGLKHYRRYPSRSARVLDRIPASAINAKLVTPELGVGLDHGCVNPRFPHLNPSGSSTGSAVAVAADICDLALGTDTTGSIRLPASACGVTGLRMTPRPEWLDGISGVSALLDAPGWLTRTPDDLAFAWDHFRLGEPVGRWQDLGPCRIGVNPKLLDEGCLPEIADMISSMADRLAAAGHILVPIDLGDLLPWRKAVWETTARDACDSRPDVGEQLQPSVENFFTYGASVTTARRAEIEGAMGRCREGISQRFATDQVDAWLLPTTNRLAMARLTAADLSESTIPDFTDPAMEDAIGYSTVASFAALPAVTVPVGIEPDRYAPVGAQLIGPPGRETGLIRLACRLAELAGNVMPPVPASGEAGA